MGLKPVQVRIMARNLVAQVSFSLWRRHMQIRVGFILGWACSYLLRAPAPVTETLSIETALLRDEIQAARTVVDHLGEARKSCEWEVWSQRWLLRLGGLVDLVLIVWIIWARFPLRRSDSPQQVVQPSVAVESSSSSDEGGFDKPLPSVLPLNRQVVAKGKGPLARNRPTRPSDLKALRA